MAGVAWRVNARREACGHEGRLRGLEIVGAGASIDRLTPGRGMVYTTFCCGQRPPLGAQAFTGGETPTQHPPIPR